MTTNPQRGNCAVLVCGILFWLGAWGPAVSQTADPKATVPSFVDSRPLPPNERAPVSQSEGQRRADDAAQRAADAKNRADADAKRIAATAEAKKAAAEAEAKRVAAMGEAKKAAEDAEARRVAAAAEAEATQIAAAAEAKKSAADAEAKQVAAAAEAKKTAAEAAGRTAAAARPAAPAASVTAAAPVTIAVPVPVAAMPQPAAVRPEGLRYLARGRELLKNGDVTAARTFFERAVQLGAADGAVELGGTYDPVMLKQLGVVGLKADPERASQLYKQAQQLGAAGADERLKRLQSGQ